MEGRRKDEEKERGRRGSQRRYNTTAVQVEGEEGERPTHEELQSYIQHMRSRLVISPPPPPQLHQP